MVSADSFNRRVGGRLRSARTNFGWTAEFLGERMDVSRQSVVNWESGRQLPQPTKLVRLGELLGVSVDWLLTGIESGQGLSADEMLPNQVEIISLYRSLNRDSRAAFLEGCRGLMRGLLLLEGQESQQLRQVADEQSDHPEDPSGP
ncbi:MAG: helix-turn-helix transcriptional regulator [Chloroflexi bacterium]|nr:helix-turn-helix transcriptional regulator [Chloroflexota bacterium]